MAEDSAALPVERAEGSFRDAYGVAVHCYRWSAPHPRGIVQIAHGLGEHALRYEPIAQALVRAGYTVCANDHRGHGRTGLEQWDGDVARLGRLGPGGLRATVGDMRELTGLLRRTSPDVPLVLLGHSWGSLMAQMLVDRDATPYAGVVLSGTAYRMPGHMNAGDLNRRHAHLGTTGYEWLSRDPAVAEAFRDDPLTFPADVARLFGIADGLRLYGRPRRLSKDVPMLLLVGSDDALGGERSVRRLARAYRERGGLSDVEVVVYPEARHEVFHELNREQVVGDLISWLDRRVG